MNTRLAGPGHSQQISPAPAIIITATTTQQTKIASLTDWLVFCVEIVSVSPSPGVQLYSITVRCPGTRDRVLAIQLMRDD